MTASLLPPNANRVERAIEGATFRLGAVPTPIESIWNPMTCPIALLPWLAWALSIDDWDAAWPEAVKRQRTAVAIAVQRRKGTAKSVRDVVRAYGADLSIREWWETSPQGEPHTFTIVLRAGSADLVDAIIRDVTRTKPLRSHFTFTQAVEAAGAVGVIGAGRACLFRRMTFAAPAA